MTSGTRRRAAALALLAGLLAGCTTPSGGNGMDPAVELAARPSSHEMITRYEQMQQRIRDRLDTELGPFQWVVDPDGGDQAGCGGRFSNLTGVTVYLPPWAFDDAIPDRDWPRAKQIVTEITAEYGFGTPTLQVDKPGQHSTSAADAVLGAQYNFGTQKATSMQVTTGCHPDAR
jgi:Lipoprotein confined to pathogenic Mycobacterium